MQVGVSDLLVMSFTNNKYHDTKEAKMRRMLVAAFVALAAAAPAAASQSTSATASGAGTVRAYGTAGPTAHFTIDFSKGTGRKITYSDRKAHIYFHSVVIRRPVFTTTAMKVSGWGYVNRRLVAFTAIATDHPAPVGDWFHISWGHGATRGGKLLSGNIRIVPLLAGGGSGGTTGSVGA